MTNKGNKNSTEKTLNKSAIIISILALIISSIAAYYSFRQTEIAQDTAIKQLRAYLIFKTQGFGFPAINTPPFAMKFGIINHGQTPARMVQIDGQIERLHFPLPDNFKPKYLGISNFIQNTTVFPGENPSYIGGISSISPSIIKELSEIKATKDTSRIYLFARITYLDCYNITRHTFLCQYIEPESVVYDLKGYLSGQSWVYYKIYNDID
jgi:hypothetical protein